jgi:hypothetical protein
MTSPLAGLRAQAAALASQRAAVIAQAAALAAKADAESAAATAAAAAGNRSAFTTAAASATATHTDRRQLLAGTTALDQQLAGLVSALTGDPCDLEPDVPLALLPVRLETRYSADSKSLQVRIYPDDIHVDRLDRGLSDDERAAGIAYWTAVWDGSLDEDTAWQTLVTAVHPDRAEYIAGVLTPDLSQRPDPPAAAPAPTFPDTTPREQRAPVARCLPDRFVVMVVQGAKTGQHTGTPIPPELIVGLPPGSDPNQLVKPTGKRPVLGPGMDWLVDPAVARSVGMLVDVPLPTPGAPVDTVVAIGVCGSLDPADGATELGQLLEAHRYAEGAEFVAPGTPTNNTETDRTAWTAKRDPQPPMTSYFPPMPDRDGGIAATALGVDSVPVMTWPGSYAEGQSLVGAAHTALWQATWGTFITRLATTSTGAPAVSDATREAWRDWWQNNVRGGGPLPILRVGNQPYGLLPTSTVGSGWTPDGSSAFEPPLLSLLSAVRPLVAGSLPAVPRMGDGKPVDVSLLDILGSSPQLQGLRVRSVGSESLANNLGTLFGFDVVATNQTAQDELTSAVWLALGAGEVALRSTMGKNTRPLGLPLVLDDATHGDKQYLEALLADQPRTVASVLQALLEICHQLEQKAVDEAAPKDSPRDLYAAGEGLAGDLSDRIGGALEQTVSGQRIDPVALHAVADQLGERFGTTGASAFAAIQPVVATRTSLANVALSLPGYLQGNQALAVLGAYFRAQARLAEFRTAAIRLIEADIDQRRIVVSETLDCASHRYDAWVASIPTARVARQRASAPTGVLLGAYGWVENLAPGAATARAGGYVHAPSLAHAATAGVLRSGYLTHNPDASGTAALAVDLSSARVRRALDLLDGVRQGQPLGALLGYLIERRLHEERLDVYTLSLRSLAPAAAGQLVDRADAAPAQAQEAIGATGVVDGIRLLQLPIADVWARLTTPPSDNPYLTDLSTWPKLEPNKPAIQAILAEAADAYDALSDVLLAESVHQLVQGNTARAAAAMDAAAGGDAPPIEPDVVRTPTRAAAVTHRVVLLLDKTTTGTPGWSATTPRAMAQPRLEAWAEGRLGPAGKIVVHVATDGTRTTLDKAHLAALDVVHDAAPAVIVPGHPSQLQAPTLEARLRAALPAIGNAPLVAARDASWPADLHAIGEIAIVAASLQRMIAAATPLTPASFARPNDKPLRTVAAPDQARWQGIVDGLVAATKALDTALAASPATPAAIVQAVDTLRAYGIAFPSGATMAAQAALAEASHRAAAAAVAVAAAPFDAKAAQTVGELVFGTGFLSLSVIDGAADLYATAYGKLKPSRGAIRRWLRDVATVRPSLARYTETLLLGDALGGSPGPGRQLGVAQLAAAGTAGVSGWLGSGLPAGAPSPDQPVTAVLIDASTSYAAGQAVSGLVVDEWGEQLPRRNADGTATVTTGVAVNANAPNARAPQAVLLAVAPDANRWTTQRLLAVLDETRELAQLRAVTLERQAVPSSVMPAIQEQSWSLQGDPTIDLGLLMRELSTTDHVLRYVKETGP